MVATNIPTRHTISASSAATLHFILPDGMHIFHLHGVFARFAATLSSTKELEVELSASGVYHDEISYWFNKKADLI